MHIRPSTRSLNLCTHIPTVELRNCPQVWMPSQLEQDIISVVGFSFPRTVRLRIVCVNQYYAITELVSM
jgi:hypothetical protein